MKLRNIARVIIVIGAGLYILSPLDMLPGLELDDAVVSILSAVLNSALASKAIKPE